MARRAGSRPCLEQVVVGEEPNAFRCSVQRVVPAPKRSLSAGGKECRPQCRQQMRPSLEGAPGRSRSGQTPRTKSRPSLRRGAATDGRRRIAGSSGVRTRVAGPRLATWSSGSPPAWLNCRDTGGPCPAASHANPSEDQLGGSTRVSAGEVLIGGRDECCILVPRLESNF